jgi:hypothetical protein
VILFATPVVYLYLNRLAERMRGLATGATAAADVEITAPPAA